MLLSQSKLKFLNSLKQKKQRQLSGCFLVEGLRTCEALLESDFEVECAVYCPDIFNSGRARDVVQRFREKQFDVYETDERTANKISDTRTPQGFFAAVRTREYQLRDLLRTNPATIVISDNISEPGNLGTLIRSAAWFGVDLVLTSHDSVEYSNPKVVRSSAGAVFNIPIIADADLSQVIPELAECGYHVVVSAADEGESYLDLDWPDKTALVLSNEASGLSDGLRGLAHQSVFVPRYGNGESLNVSAAAAILMAFICSRTGKKTS